MKALDEASMLVAAYPVEDRAKSHDEAVRMQKLLIEVAGALRLRIGMPAHSNLSDGEIFYRERHGDLHRLKPERVAVIKRVLFAQLNKLMIYPPEDRERLCETFATLILAALDCE